jgi:hypothetical protein
MKNKVPRATKYPEMMVILGSLYYEMPYPYVMMSGDFCMVNHLAELSGTLNRIE